jgi:uncharacterized membrane protein
MKLFNDHTKELLILGTLSGMRTNAGVLVTNLLLRQQPGLYFSPSRLVKFFYNKKTTVALTVSAATEVVIDKLPGTPDRIAAGGLTGRAFAGAISGATISKAAGKNAVEGAVISGLAAIASSFAFYYLRKNIGEKARVADPSVGVAEDLLALAIGVALLRNNKLSRKITR